MTPAVEAIRTIGYTEKHWRAVVFNDRGQQVAACQHVHSRATWAMACAEDMIELGTDRLLAAVRAS